MIYYLQTVGGQYLQSWQDGRPVFTTCQATALLLTCDQVSLQYDAVQRAGHLPGLYVACGRNDSQA